MKALDLNFATVPLRNNTPFYLSYALGVLAIAAFTAYNTWAFFAYAHSGAALQSDYAAKRIRLDALYRDAARLADEVKQKNIEGLNARSGFTNGLLERRRFSWTDLLNSMEEVQPYQVRLLSLIPRIQEKGILIEARAVAKDLKAFWNFQQNIQNHPKFRRVYPGGYLRNTDAGEYIFNIAFNYFPDGAPVGVEGLTPEMAGIVEAPGEDGAALRDEQSAEDEFDEPAADEGGAPPVKKTATRAAASGAGAGGAGASSAARKKTQANKAAPVNPPAAPPPRSAERALDDKTQPAQPGVNDARGPAARPALPRADAFAATAPAPAIPAAENSASPEGAPQKPRFGGRGIPPGTGGILPPQPPKAVVPTLPVIGKPPSPPDDTKKKGDGGGGNR